MNIFLAPEIQIYFGLSAFFFLVLSFFNPAVGLVLMAFAMLFSPEFEVGVFGSRVVAIRAEDVLIPLLMVAWIARLAIRREFRLLVASPLNIPILLVLVLSVYSAVRGMAIGAVTSPLLPLFYIGKTTEFFAIFFLVLSYVRSERQIGLFLFFVLLTLSLVGIYTLFQVPSVEIFTERRITGPFEGRIPEPGTVGGYMAFLLLIVLSLFLYEKHPSRRWLYGLIGGVVIVPFVYTLNRTSYIALLGGLVFITFIERRRKWIGLMLISLLLSSPFWMPQPVKERIAFTLEDAINPGRTLGVDAASQGRIISYMKSWNCVRYGFNVVWGCGVGATDNPDSQYARTLYEMGSLGLVLWAWIFLRLFRISRWLFHSLEEDTWKGLVLGYRAGLVGILLHGFGTVTLYTVRIMEPFWFITGLVVSLYLIKIGEEQMLVKSSEDVTE